MEELVLQFEAKVEENQGFETFLKELQQKLASEQPAGLETSLKWVVMWFFTRCKQSRAGHEIWATICVVYVVDHVRG